MATEPGVGVRSPDLSVGTVTAMKAVWGKEPDLAVAETADHDALDCATWTIAALGESSQQISQRLDQVEKAIQERIDAAILDVHREIL